MQISKKQLIDLVRAAHYEGVLDGTLEDCRLPEALWMGSDTLYNLREVLDQAGEELRSTPSTKGR